MTPAHRPDSREKGTYLLEALIAILLFAVGILGLVGLLATSVRASNDARYRTEAANIANGMVAAMWTMNAADMAAKFQAGGTALVDWQAKASNLLPAGAAAVDLTLPALSSQSTAAVVTITWQLPGSREQHNYVMTAQVGRNAP